MGILDLINTVEGIYVLYGYTIAFLASLIEISPMGWTIPGGALLALGGFYAFWPIFWAIRPVMPW